MTDSNSDEKATRAIPQWFVYLVRCSDNSLYTGITTDLSRRLQEHNSSPLGAKYTQSRRPVNLVYWESFPDRAAAARREYQLKKFPVAAKKALIDSFQLDSRTDPPVATPKAD